MDLKQIKIDLLTRLRNGQLSPAEFKTELRTAMKTAYLEICTLFFKTSGDDPSSTHYITHHIGEFEVFEKGLDKILTELTQEDATIDQIRERVNEYRNDFGRYINGRYASREMTLNALTEFEALYSQYPWFETEKALFMAKFNKLIETQKDINTSITDIKSMSTDLLRDYNKEISSKYGASIAVDEILKEFEIYQSYGWYKEELSRFAPDLKSHIDGLHKNNASLSEMKSAGARLLFDYEMSIARRYPGTVNLDYLRKKRNGIYSPQKTV